MSPVRRVTSIGLPPKRDPSSAVYPLKLEQDDTGARPVYDPELNVEYRGLAYGGHSALVVAKLQFSHPSTGPTASASLLISPYGETPQWREEDLAQSLLGPTEQPGLLIGFIPPDGSFKITGTSGGVVNILSIYVKRF